MTSKSIVALTLGWLMMGHGPVQGADLYTPAETFTEPELGLVLDIQSGAEEVARQKLKAGLDLNQPVAPPVTFDYFRILGLSPLQRKLGDALTPAPYGGRSTETLTILNFFIANDDLNAIRLALKLGADPNAKGKWYFDSFRFASEFNRSEAYELIIQAFPYSTMTQEEQAYRLRDLRKINTVNHLFSDTEYRLDPALLEVAKRHHANFNLEVSGETMLTDNMNLSGYEMVLWLLEKTDIDPSTPNRWGKTAASMTADWLRAIKPDDRQRLKMLRRIKDTLEKKGITVN